ncbi:MAG: type II toxin-antitoxin system VapC family toxin [Nitrososphaerota archaeon]|nr:type II toxin-antitoxin system VapC family toxin [Nitrososphaerota archaeon]
MILLDSSLLIAYKVRNDVHHEKANALMKQVVSERFGKPVISDYIFDETVTGIFARSRNLRLSVEYAKELLASLEMLKVDEKTFREAWEIFSRQEKRELSFTDSTTIALMKIHYIGNVGTFDGDFKAIKGIDAIG